MTRRASTLFAFALALAPVAAGAIDSPHDQTFSDGACSHCHGLYARTPSGDADYSPGCISCHNALPQTTFGFPWLSSDQAVPGAGGNQHSWSGYAVNPLAGSQIPYANDIAAKLVDGRLQCATCHDPHKSAPQNAPGKQHTSIPVGTAVDETGGPAAGTGTMTLVTAGTATKAYRVKIQTAAAGGGTFVISHDFGLATPSWFNWNGSAWVVGTAAGAGKPYTDGAAVALDDSAVTVRFAAGAVPDNYWDFYVSYPFLRATTYSDSICVMCHPDVVMTSARVRGEDPGYRPDGTKRFSHPTGEALNSNGRNHDRLAAEVLDASGVTQAAGDGNGSNDLVLQAGLVRCTTCHAVHGADSNSLTVDPR